VRAGSPLLALFWLVDARGPKEGRDFALAMNYPRRRFARPAHRPADEGPSLLAENLASEPQQAFFVEQL